MSTARPSLPPAASRGCRASRTSFAVLKPAVIPKKKEKESKKREEEKKIEDGKKKMKKKKLGACASIFRPCHRRVSVPVLSNGELQFGGC